VGPELGRVARRGLCPHPSEPGRGHGPGFTRRLSRRTLSARLFQDGQQRRVPADASRRDLVPADKPCTAAGRTLAEPVRCPRGATGARIGHALCLRLSVQGREDEAAPAAIPRRRQSVSATASAKRSGAAAEGHRAAIHRTGPADPRHMRLSPAADRRALRQGFSGDAADRRTRPRARLFRARRRTAHALEPLRIDDAGHPA
jgi:hypothetical protein